MNKVIFRTFFSIHETENENKLKSAYKNWADGAIAVAPNDKPFHYYNNFIIEGISYADFLSLIQED